MYWDEHVDVYVDVFCVFCVHFVYFLCTFCVFFGTFCVIFGTFRTFFLPFPSFSHLSLTHLFSALLHPNPSDRLTMSALSQHPLVSSIVSRRSIEPRSPAIRDHQQWSAVNMREHYSIMAHSAKVSLSAHSSCTPIG